MARVKLVASGDGYSKENLIRLGIVGSGSFLAQFEQSSAHSFSGDAGHLDSKLGPVNKLDD